jgi:hypothetical protein
VYAPCRFVQRQSSSRDDVELYVYLTARREPPDAYPLHKRGWVFQDRLLPVRTLRFAPIVSFECQETLDHEFSFERAHSVCRSFGQWLIKSGVSREREPGWNENALMRYGELQRLYEYWCNTILDQISEAAFSVPADRLRAIQGVISIMEEATGWRNASGLWLPFIGREFLWQRGEGKKRPASGHGRTGLRPSWSWISIRGPISPYPTMFLGGDLTKVGVLDSI